MTEPLQTQQPQQPQKGLGAGAVVLIALGVFVATLFLAYAWLFPRPFTPVELTKSEQTALDKKVRTLNIDLQTAPRGKAQDRVVALEPLPYSEEGARRDIIFTEREINALLATNTELADKVAIDLSPGLVSARAVIPLDPDMPVLGGKTLKISAGVELAFRNGRPVVALKGVSVWGVPVPNAWLGDLKNVDLVAQYGDAGFWKSFAAGVDNIAVGEGKLTVKLRE